ncbi:cysteine-rich receptor-like protein kinase 8 [Tanacetum coccineum]|uniref:Cysteine-rich receptor-like protein kinase 8 n=1 Tax=Tanacetum coccineum TaxID=301880 RepID=A0ABQ4WUB8_9ASTR
MSATALLQKASQMESRRSTNSGGYGLMSTSELSGLSSLNQTGSNSVSEAENFSGGMMNGDGLMMMMMMDGLKQKTCGIDSNDGNLTRDFLGVEGLWDEYDSLEAPYICVCAYVYENGKFNGERDQRKRLIEFLMGFDERYAYVRGQILLMNPIPTVAKAYRIIKQEEKQREGFSFRNTPTALTAHSNNLRNSYSNNLRKGVICGNCNREGHTKEECYKIVGYLVGHPLHGKYKPLNQTLRNNVQDNNGSRTVNMEMTQGISVDASVANAPNDAAMSARMDQLHNQLNQMILMVGSNKETIGMPFMSSEGKPKLIASYITRSYKFIASHISALRYNNGETLNLHLSSIHLSSNP